MRQLYLLVILFLGVACHSSTEDAHEGHTVAEHANHMASVADTSLADIVRSVNQTVISSQQMVKPVMQTAGSIITLNGYITEDPGRNQAVSIRIGGRIEKLYVKYNYQYIRKGEKVLDIYSPELRTSQEEYLYLVKTKADRNLITNATQKLRLLGLSQHQINTLEKSGQLSFTVSIFSPFSGYVIVGNTSPAMTSKEVASAAEDMRMNAGASNTGTGASAITQTNTALREGTYVNVGQTLFTINDFKKVWALLSIHAEEASFLEVNTPLKIVSEVSPEKPIPGKINLIEPVFREDIQFMQARVYLDNPGGALKANSLVKAEIEAGNQAMMLVPSSSISDLGGRKIVWVKTKDTPSGKKVFEPRTVLTGIRSGDFTQIIQGLNKDEVIAKQAGYLLDSESIVD